MILITDVRMSPPTSRNHQHITGVRWRNPQSDATGASTVPTLVDWLENKGGVAQVTDGRKTVDVAVVHADRPYIRTVADGVYTDNLLALPRY